MELTTRVIAKVKEFGLWTTEEEVRSLLSHYVPMKAEYYHSQKTPKVFKNTHLLQESANKKLETGRYCEYAFESKLYNDWANEEIRRCREGYTINKGTKYELSITGYHYFFLNYKQLMYEEEGTEAAKGREWGFPKFIEIQYHFFWAYEEALKARKNFILLKPRGIGFSEMIASIGSCNYVLRKDKNFFFTMLEDQLLKDGVFQKVNDNIDFLNAESDNLFFHNKLINKDNHKQAGIKYTTHNERTGGELVGKVIDDARKARGSRGMFIVFDEAGSFKNLVKAFNTAIASIKQTSGRQFGTILVGGCVCAGTKVWNNRGEQVNVEDITLNSGIVGYNGISTIPQEILQLKLPEYKECVEITFNNKEILRCSVDHPILTYSKKGATFIQAKDLVIGSRVTYADNVDIFGNISMWNPRLIGLLIGDGNYSCNSTPQISSHEPDIINYIAQYNPKIYRTKTTKKGEQHNHYGFKQIRPILKELGIYGQTKGNKTLPVNIWQYDKQSICELIGGIYDADGNVKYDSKRGVSIVLTQAHEEILKSIKTQLFKLGIHSYIVKEFRKDGYKPNTVVYRLYITDCNSVIRFKEQIKFLSVVKQSVLDKAIIKPRTCLLTNRKYIKGEKGEYFNDMLLSNFRTCRVTNVKNIGQQQVYNLNAGTTHTYLANNIITHNTGGDMDYVEGLREMFYSPEAFNAAVFKNKWSKDNYSAKCGWFAPTYYYSLDYVDIDGNIDTLSAFLDLMRDRFRDSNSNLASDNVDQRSQEYPITPEEALNKRGRSYFDKQAIERQLHKLEMNPIITKLWINGWFFRDESGTLRFRTSETARPLEDYPIKPDTTGKLKGCVSILETPRRVEGVIPPIYILAVDGYYTDQSEYSDSVGAVYVVKTYNKYVPKNEYSGNIVAKYVGRPETTKHFARIVFDMAEYYNTKIHFEMRGGGKIIFDYARDNKKERWLAVTLDKSKKAIKRKATTYGDHFTEEENKLGITYLDEWLKTAVEVDEEKLLYKERVYNVLDVGFLRECLKFEEGKNYDRLSAMRHIMFVLKEEDKVDESKPLVNPYEILNSKIFGWLD